MKQRKFLGEFHRLPRAHLARLITTRFVWGQFGRPLLVRSESSFGNEVCAMRCASPDASGQVEGGEPLNPIERRRLQQWCAGVSQNPRSGWGRGRASACGSMLSRDRAHGVAPRYVHFAFAIEGAKEPRERAFGVTPPTQALRVGAIFGSRECSCVVPRTGL